MIFNLEANGFNHAHSQSKISIIESLRSRLKIFKKSISNAYQLKGKYFLKIKIILENYRMPNQMNFSFYHNNDGFSEEIRQLESSLTEYINERNFLKNDIIRLNNEIKQLKNSGSEQRELYDKLMVALVKKNRSVKENRLKLQEHMMLFVKINFDLMYKYKISRQLEGQIELSSNTDLESEKSLLINKLKYSLSKLEIESHHSNNEIDELRVVLDQKERLSIALKSLLEDLDSKMTEVSFHEPRPKYYYESSYKEHRRRQYKSLQNFSSFTEISPTSYTRTTKERYVLLE